MENSTPQPIKLLKQNVKPEEIAVQYLKHEFIKLFSNPSKLLDKVDNFPQEMGKDFWQLVSGISEGYKMKWVYRVLTDNKYSWTLEQIALDDVTLTGMSEFMDNVINQANGKPSNFAQIWAKNPEFAKTPDGAGIKAHLERDDFPILLWERYDQLHVFDGMRRTCVAAITQKTEITAWVGRITNLDGQMMVNKDKVLFLRALYDESPDKDAELLDGIVKVMKGYIKLTRNGREVVENVLNKWKDDPNLVEVVEEILAIPDINLTNE